MLRNIFFLFCGTGFGFVLVLSGITNYNVIYDMFLFKSFHMYGLLGTTLFLTTLATFLLKKWEWKGVLTGIPLRFEQAKPTKNHVIGGILAGLGWGLTGACPGPAMAQLGFGAVSAVFSVLGIFLGVYIYGILESRKSE